VQVRVLVGVRVATHPRAAASSLGVSYDKDADAAWTGLTERADELPGPVSSVAVEVPENSGGAVVLDFKYGTLVGIEVLGAVLPSCR
jgi:hypothetical protein